MPQLLFDAGRPQHALGVHETLAQGGAALGSAAVLAAVLRGLLRSQQAAALAVRAIALYNELREADADAQQQAWPELTLGAVRTCLKADMLQVRRPPPAPCAPRPPPVAILLPAFEPLDDTPHVACRTRSTYMSMRRRRPPPPRRSSGCVPS